MCVSVFVIGCTDTSNDGDKDDDGQNQPEDPDNKNDGDNKENEDDKKDDGENEEESKILLFNVTFTDAEGNPIEGLYAGICIGGSCGSPRATDAAGLVVLAPPKTPGEGDAINLQVTQAPAGFVKPEGYIELFADKLDVTIVIEKVPA